MSPSADSKFAYFDPVRRFDWFLKSQTLPDTASHRPVQWEQVLEVEAAKAEKRRKATVV